MSDNPGVGAICPRCGSLYCSGPATCKRSLPDGDAEILRLNNALCRLLAEGDAALARVAELEAERTKYKNAAGATWNDLVNQGLELDSLQHERDELLAAAKMLRACVIDAQCVHNHRDAVTATAWLDALPGPELGK